MKKIRILFLLLFALVLATGEAKAQDACIGELRLFPYNFAPTGWLECAGQTLSISQYTALFSLLGTYYGGNGTSNFMLPNLQGRTPIMPGSVSGLAISLGSTGGTETETMTAAQLPAHTHTTTNATMVSCSNSSGTTNTPGVYAVNTARGNEFNTTSNASSGIMSVTVGSAGTSQPRNNMQPYTTLVWCICVNGTYPVRP